MQVHLPKPLSSCRLSDFRETASSVYKSGRFTPAICLDINTPAADANTQQVAPYPQ